MRLRLCGLTWRSLARQIGVAPQTVHSVASGKPSVPVERAIADAIGVAPQALFTEHWTSAGVRIPIERTTLHKAKSIAPPSRRNVYPERVA